MPTIDLSDLQDASEAEPLTVKLPGGEEVTLLTMLQIPDADHSKLLKIFDALSKLAGDDTSDDTSEGETMSVGLEQVAEIMPQLNELMRIATPNKKAADAIQRRLGNSPMAKLQLAMSYLEHQDLGKASQSDD